MKVYEAKALAERYFEEWLKIPVKDAEKDRSFISAIQYALMKNSKNKKDGKPN